MSKHSAIRGKTGGSVHSRFSKGKSAAAKPGKNSALSETNNSTDVTEAKELVEARVSPQSLDEPQAESASMSGDVSFVTFLENASAAGASSASDGAAGSVSAATTASGGGFNPLFILGGVGLAGGVAALAAGGGGEKDNVNVSELTSETKALTEGDAKLSTSGKLVVTDLDATDATVVVQTDKAGTYGKFGIDATGAWTYVTNDAVNQLDAGQVVTETFNVATSDGGSATVTVRITGTNDVATLTSETKSLIESDAVLSTSGKLVVTDLDATDATVVPQTATAGAYGKFSIDATGAWTYATNDAVNQLDADQVAIETFSVVTSDGGTAAVTVRIAGTNDVAALTSETKPLTESDAVLSTSGKLVLTDLDATDAVVVAQTGKAGTYGKFSIDATGAWTYATNDAVNQLDADQVVTETFNVATSDGGTAAVTVRITGTNDVATLTGETKALTESDAVLSTSGKLVLTDLDTTDAVVVAQTDKAGAYGKFSIDAAGAWTYATNDAVNQLDAAQVVTETFNVTTNDGGSATVTVRITGTNDLPEVVEALTDRSVSFSEAAPAETAPSSKFIRVAGVDRDGGDVTFTIPTETTNATLTRGPDGTGFTYTPKDINYHGTETITVRLNDAQGDGKFTDYQVTVVVAPEIAENLKVDNGLNLLALDANGSGYTLGDNFAFIDNSALPTNVEITNFRLGDTIRVSAAASKYNFTVSEGGDLEITYTDTATGAPNSIVLKGVAATAGFIDDEASAEQLLGLGNFFLSDVEEALVGSGSLDVDNDGNINSYALFDAAGGNVAFTENGSIANRAAILGFSQGDTITVSNALVTDYNFGLAGNDIVITYNNDFGINEIVLAGAVADPDTTSVSELADVQALFGAGFFVAASGSGSGGFDPSDSLSIDNAAGTQVLNAAVGSLLFVDDAALRTDVLITGFSADDRISTNTSIDNYNFGVADWDFDDLVMTFTNNGTPNQIVIDGILRGKDVYIDSYETARDAVGSEFMVFA